MPGCALRASGGEAFVPGNHVALFPVANISPEAPVLIVPVSDCDGGDLPGQVRDAVKFLATHERAIMSLLSGPGVSASLDFGVWSKDTWCQSTVFPPELVAAAGAIGLGLEVSMYASS